MQLRDQRDAFDARNAVILAISSEDLETAAAVKADHDLPFPVLADPERQVITAYGLLHENEPKGRLIARPATLVIDAEGIITYRYVGDSATDRPEIVTVLAAVDVASRADPMP